MSNMSYCRFQNTYPDLRDCFDHMDDGDLSEEEAVARQRIIDLCKDIAASYGDEDEST